MQKQNMKKTIYYLFLLMCIVLLLFSIIKIIMWHKDNYINNKLQDESQKNVTERKSISEKTENINPPKDKNDDYWDYIKMEILDVDFKELMKKNPDTVGFIKVNGTNINYPVVQTTNNDYYLYHAYDKSKNNAGWVFADYRNDMVSFDKNTIIYGHGRLNNTMFGSLKGVLSSDWYNNKNNYIIKFSTPTENTLWQVFSVYSITAENYYITTEFSNNKTYGKFINTIKSRSQKNFNTTVDTNDKIITLSTCKDIAGKERVVMHAKLIKIEYLSN